MAAPTQFVDHRVDRYLRTLRSIEKEAMIADDTPAWLVGLLGGVDPVELSELLGDQCPTCGNRDLLGETAEGIARLNGHSVRVAGE